MRSIQAKIILIFSLLIIIAMQFIGAFLLRSLAAYYFATAEGRLTVDAQVLAKEVAPFLSAPFDPGQAPGDPAGQGGSGPDGGEQADGETGGATGGETGGSRDEERDPQAAVQALVEELGRGRYGQILVVDPTGTVLAASDPTRVGTRLLQEATVLFRVLEQGQVQSYPRIDPETGRHLLDVAAPIITADGRAVGVAVVEGDLNEAQQTLQAIREILLEATLVALAVGLVLAAVMARTITGPIQVITSRAAQMAEGDFDQRIQVRSNDELGRLAGMFNLLAGRLKETLAEISDEKRKVEAIVTHMADGVVAFDRQRRIVLVNPAALRMLGTVGGPPDDAAAGSTGDGVLGRRAEEVWPGLGIEELLNATLRGEGDYAERPLVVRCGERTLRTYLAPIGGGDEPAGAGAVWVLHDVTELERVETMRREFVANVSHELRTPLTTIKSYVETLLDQGPDDPETQRRFLRVIDAETDRMVRLVRDLLDLSQLEFQNVRYEREYCQLSELARQVLAKLQGQIADKGVLATLETPSEAEPLVYVDPDRIQQVLVNILSNAIEFTPRDGQVTVRILPAGDAVRVEVQDTGIGIPPEDLPRVFERFYRVDKARTRRLGGTGLGLSIARQIIEGHGGRIGIQSEPGRGTLVWFTIPRESEAPAG